MQGVAALPFCNSCTITSNPDHRKMDYKKITLIACGAVGAAALAALLGTAYKRSHAPKGLIGDDFVLTKENLLSLVSNFKDEMNLGLNGTGSSLKMLPSFVGKATGKESGVFYALDLGGTNFRVIKIPLHGDKRIDLNQCEKKQFVISNEVMHGTSQQLFDFIAESVGSCISSVHGTESILLGFTFSFPVNQLSINSGTLIKWTKGFTTSDVEGEDVVKLLQGAFVRKNINAKIVALANDTVGTLMAACYSNPDCEIGVILGTGSNACYSEKYANMTNFHKNHPEVTYKCEDMIINMEWGAFGDNKGFLPLTFADTDLDSKSLNPRAQLFEKMVSGMYLGELLRLVIVKEISTNFSFLSSAHVQQTTNSIFVPYSLNTSFISDILSDTNLQELPNCSKVLSTHFGMTKSTLGDRQFIYKACVVITERAARLSASAIYAVLSKINRTTNVKVAVDGSVYEHIPGFRSKMMDTLKELDPASNIDLILSKDGSGIGAAIIAAVSTQQ